MHNQMGEPINETFINWPSQLDEDTLKWAVFLLLEHFKLDLVFTNATEHGNTELQLRSKE